MIVGTSSSWKATLLLTLIQLVLWQKILCTIIDNALNPAFINEKTKALSRLDHIHITKISGGSDDDDDEEQSRATLLKSLESGTHDTTLESGTHDNTTGSWLLKRRLFVDKIAILSSTLLRSDNATIEEEIGEDGDGDGDEFTHQSDLTIANRSIVVVSTAALPWMTGTAINPLLRAGHLCRYTKRLLQENENELPLAQLAPNSPNRLVTLVLPWLELEEDREKLYGDGNLFENEIEQEAYIREWLKGAGLEEESCNETGLKIIWYPARYHDDLGSIFAMGDICSLIPDSDADVCILEEPEHLNWYRAPGDGWTTKFNYVIGIVHTNYKEYVSGQYHGLWTSPAIQIISAAMVRAYCHKVIKLSAVLQEYAPEKEQIVNVHGVRDEFLLNHTNFSQLNQTYFIGKTLWAKGFDKMLELQDYYKQCTGNYFDVHIYGNGPDYDDIVRAFHGRKHHFKLKMEFVDEDDDYDDDTKLLSKITNISKIDLDTIIPKSRHEFRKTPISNAIFMGRVDHLQLAQGYKIFVNPSVSEVLCTTTAEALAMGKFVILPVHPSNEFFIKFPNCLAYHNKLEFAANLRWALLHTPEPLSDADRMELTWEAATYRFIKAAGITKTEAHVRAKLGKRKLDERIAWFHNQLGKGVKGDTIRKVLGAGPVSDQVRYTLEKQQDLYDTDQSSDEDDEEEDDGILPKKFSKSAFVEALRSSLKLGLFSNSNSVDDSDYVKT